MNRVLLSPLRAAAQLSDATSGAWPTLVPLCCQRLHDTRSSSSQVNTALRSDVEAAFQRDAGAAAETIASLPKEHTYMILNALAASQEQPGSPRYMNKLLNHADLNKDGLLDACAPHATSLIRIRKCIATQRNHVCGITQHLDSAIHLTCSVRSICFVCVLESWQATWSPCVDVQGGAGGGPEEAPHAE
jgi:hypothetical protein